MSEPLSETRIVEALAEHVAGRLTRKVIAELHRIKNSLLFGDDSGLQSTWDEICVQVQGEQSYHWDAYEGVVTSTLERLVATLPVHEREALWLQSEEGIDWRYEEEDERDADPVLHEDIVGYLLAEHILPAAQNWTNARIRAYLDE